VGDDGKGPPAGDFGMQITHAVDLQDQRIDTAAGAAGTDAKPREQQEKGFRGMN
jgi:hypothetical protein